MERENQCAFPADARTMTDGGMTIREHIATQILAGISANRWSMELGNYTFEILAEMAVRQADALIKELHKTKKSES